MHLVLCFTYSEHLFFFFLVVISIDVHIVESQTIFLLFCRGVQLTGGKGQDVKGWHVYVKGAVAIVMMREDLFSWI